MGRAPREDCAACVHFYVTWDPRFPRGCRALGFKCRDLPSALVRQASGLRCLRFERKTPRSRPG